MDTTTQFITDLFVYRLMQFKRCLSFISTPIRLVQTAEALVTAIEGQAEVNEEVRARTLLPLIQVLRCATKLLYNHQQPQVLSQIKQLPPHPIQPYLAAFLQEVTV